ncbi:MAG: error-prone DNA polymerase, partial [Dehalococcoidia bacterium]|nr:error-prone DNA polymerase [Dehalococcoidia bacterium]
MSKSRTGVSPVEERLERELEVIGKLGFETYFLVAWDIARFARERGIRFHVRGSAVNSLVVHCLGISAVDPLEYDLLFERFMHLGRREMPDIDWDFQRTRRDEVRDHLQQKYGKENVAAVATISTYRARGVAREVGKALGLPQRFIEEVLQGVRWQSFSSILGRTGVSPVNEARLPSMDAQVKTFLRLCSALDGFPSHLSVHLGGLVIGPAGSGLTSLTPLQWTTGGDIISQYDKDDIEKLGLIKMDIIPVPTLDVIEDSLTEIKRNRGIEVNIDAVPRDDHAVFAMHRRSETIGAFQVES